MIEQSRSGHRHAGVARHAARQASTPPNAHPLDMDTPVSDGAARPGSASRAAEAQDALMQL